MQARAAMLAAILASMGCISQVNGMPMEDRIFERPAYAKAAAAVAQGDVAALEKLVRSGLDVNVESRETQGPWGADSMTLLVWAALKDNLKGAEALLKAGADPNKATRRGMTPLMLAAGSRSDELLALLLTRHRADPNRIFGRPFETALTLALKERRSLGEKRFKHAELLISHGADVNLDIDRGETALIRFGILEDWRAVHWLLEHGANPEARDTVRATVMCYLRGSYRAGALAISEAHIYRDKVRDWLLAHSIGRSRIDPLLHPNPKCDD